MERRTEFGDETFYDVSTWTLPLAFNLPSASSGRLPPEGADTEPPSEPLALDFSANYFALRWNRYSAPAALQRLLAANLRVGAANKPFSANTANGTVAFERGTLVLPYATYSEAEKTETQAILNSVQAAGETVISAISSGLTPEGIDLGSNHLRHIEPIKPLLLTGWEASGYEAGEVWHLLDTRVGLAPVMIDSYQLGEIDLRDYTHLIVVNGNYDKLPAKTLKAVESWIEDGGILVATKDAAVWAESLFADDETEADTSEAEPIAVEKRPYAAFDDDEAQRIIGGAIVASTLDLTHPLAFGYQRSDLPLFRNSTVLLEPSKNAYATVAYYDDEPLLSGFAGPERLEEMKGQPAMIAERVKKGLVVRIADNPGFRAYWYGTQRLLLNSLYFGQIVDTTELD
jgi:hypothetical protein